MAKPEINWSDIEGNDKPIVYMGVINCYYIAREFHNPFDGYYICAFNNKGEKVASVKVEENETRYQAFIRAINNCFYKIPPGDVPNEYVNAKVQNKLAEYDRKRKYAW